MELGGAARDVVNVVVVDVVGARRSHPRRGRRGRSSAWLARRGLLDGSLRLANGSDSLFDGLESHLGDDVAVGDLVVMR